MANRKRKKAENAKSAPTPPLQITELKPPVDAFQDIANIIIERLEIVEGRKKRDPKGPISAEANAINENSRTELEQEEDEAWDELCTDLLKLIRSRVEDRKAWMRSSLLRLSNAILAEVMRMRDFEAQTARSKKGTK
jgi:hypothetical protein